MDESHSQPGVEHDSAITATDHGTHDHSGHEDDAHDHSGREHAGHEHTAHDHSAHDPAQFRRKFWLSLALTVPTLVFSTGLQSILGLGGPRFPGSQYIPAVFGVAIFVYGGLVFLRGAASELRARQPGMMTLISLAIVVALAYSLAVTLGLPGMDFWWELATLITIMLLGHWIEMSAVMGARDALGELAKLLPDEAELVHGDHVMTVAVASLVPGDTVLVRPGGAIPVDGEVIEGESDVDEALLTGESAAVAKAVGSTVIAGSTNDAGALTIRVGAVGGQTALAGIMRLVDEAQRSKSGAQVLADRAAGRLFYIAVGAAVVTLAAWWLLKPGDPGFVLERVVSVLVIACPHALGLAIPLVSQISTSLGAKQGILVKNKLALEAARRVDVVLFDKTGTLTTGLPSVTAVVSADGGRGAATVVDRANEVLALAASVEAKSEHPLASAIVAEARTRGLKVVRAAKFSSLAGRGATATLAGRELTVASQRLLTERAITLPAELVHATREHSASGATIVYLLATATATAKASVSAKASAKAGASAKAKAKAEPRVEVLGLIALTDTVRAEAPEAVSMLLARGIRVAMLTGDSHAVATSVAATLGITEVFAEVLPGQKADVVHKLRAAGDRVAMVGDGVNDAPALALADVGIAIGAGTDVAIESAGIVLASSDPRGVSKLFTLSRATWRKQLQNLFWATVYNAVGIPLAAGVAAGAGILLPPALAAVLMSASTIIVALNAQLLRLLKLR